MIRYERSRGWVVVACVAAAMILAVGFCLVVDADAPTIAARGEVVRTGLAPAQHQERNPGVPAPVAAPVHIGPVGEDFDTMVGLHAYASGTTTTTARRVAPRASRSAQRPAAPVDAPGDPTGERRWIESSAYTPCSAGQIMANGQRVYDGAVASTVLKRGTKWRVVEGPTAGRTYTVADTGGPRATFDIWMPSCPAAIQYGRPTILIERVE